MSSPCVAAVLAAFADCPNCRSEQKQSADGRAVYVLELCDEHAVSKDYFLPLLVTIEIRTRTSLVATVDDSKGCLQQNVCPACRDPISVPLAVLRLWRHCGNCGADWPAA